MTVYRYYMRTAPTTTDEMLTHIEQLVGPATNIAVVVKEPGFMDVDLTNAGANSKADLDGYLIDLGFDAGVISPGTPDPGEVLGSDGVGAWDLRKNTIYDCVVPDDYALPSDAFSSGCTSVFVRDGSYVETADVDIPDGGQLVGEGGAELDLSGGFQIQVGDTSRLETTGTVDTTTGSTTVVGTGTTFTNLQAGDYILLDGAYYEIDSITDATNLELRYSYVGEALTGIPMVGQSMALSCHVRNLRVFGGALPAIAYNQAMQSSIEEVTVREGGTGLLGAIQVTRSGEVTIQGTTVEAATSDGLQIATSNNIDVSGGAVFKGNARDGIHVILSSEVAVSCQAVQNGRHGVYLAIGAQTVVCDNCQLNFNDEDGFHVVQFASNLDSVLSNSHVLGNGARGVDLNGAKGICNGCVISNNGDAGIWSGEDAQIMGCYVSENGAEGITAFNDAHTMIANCHVFGNTGDGIVAGEEGNVVACLVYNNGGTGIRTDGNDNVTISGNGVFTNGGNGIAVETGSVDCLVSSNRSSGNGGSDYLNAGTSTRSDVWQTLQSGRSAGTTPGTFYRAINGMLLNAGNGGIPCRAGTLRRLAWTRSDADPATLEVLVNGVLVATLPSAAAGVVTSTPNVDIAAGLMSFRNLAGGNTTSAVQITADIEVEPGG